MMVKNLRERDRGSMLQLGLWLRQSERKTKGAAGEGIRVEERKLQLVG